MTTSQCEDIYFEVCKGRNWGLPGIHMGSSSSSRGVGRRMYAEGLRALERGAYFVGAVKIRIWRSPVKKRSRYNALCPLFGDRPREGYRYFHPIPFHPSTIACNLRGLFAKTDGPDTERVYLPCCAPRNASDRDFSQTVQEKRMFACRGRHSFD